MRLNEQERIRDPNPNIKDGGHIILECSQCGCPLVDFFLTGPDFPIETIAKCNCPYCGDHSFEKTIKGRFHIGCTEFSAIAETIVDNNRLDVRVLKGEKSYG